MSMVIYVGLDVHLNSIAAVWGRAKDRPRSIMVVPDEEGLEALETCLETCRGLGEGGWLAMSEHSSE